MNLFNSPSLLLTLCMAVNAPLALAATDAGDQRVPTRETAPTTDHSNNQGATGAGTPADSMGTGDGGTDDNGTDNTGGDGTDDGAGSAAGGTGSSGAGTGSRSGSGS